MPFVLRDPVTGLFFCDEPYVALTKRGADGKRVETAIGRGCAVRRAEDATVYPTEARARRSPGAAEFPEVLPR